MMNPQHHLSDAVLMEHAAGALHEAQSLLVATHSMFCDHCRSRVAEAESVGGALLDGMLPEAVSDQALAQVLARLDDPVPTQVAPPPQAESIYPGPLQRYLGAGGPAWRTLGPGIKQCLLETGGNATARLMRLDPGVRLPAHAHRGLELTLVLEGGYSDDLGHYLRGDVSELTQTDHHQPAIDEDGVCTALVVTEAPALYDGMLYRLLQPLIGL